MIATKCYPRTDEPRWDEGNSRRSIQRAIEGSLRRLNTDYIDLYQLHMPDPDTPIDESLQALDDAVAAGKILYAGCSNFPAYQVALGLGRSWAMGITRFQSVQPRYNLLFRQIERELLPLCEQEALGVFAFNPLAGGLLSGKYERIEDPPPAGTRFSLPSTGCTYLARYWHCQEFETVQKLKSIAGEAGIPLPTLAVAWVLSKPVVTSAIVGASHPEQLESTVAGAVIALERDVIEALNEVTNQFRLGDAPR